MNALTIYEMAATQIKALMGKLLREDTFDDFEVRGVEIQSMTKFEISGILSKDYYDCDAEAATENTDEPAETSRVSVRKYCTWQELRPHAFNIVRGGKRPKSIKVVFSAPAQMAESVHTNAMALYLNLLYEDEKVVFTTATAQKVFALDKSLDDAWDAHVRRFFAANDIFVSTPE